MGSVSIDLSLANIWQSWQKFRRGKRKSKELEHFQYYVEENLRTLHDELNGGIYRHGGYRKFIVHDNKRREVAVASIRDRVVHRLAYEYLVLVYDKMFIYDAWSCRKKKGLVDAIERTQSFLGRFPCCFVWRSDIKKFFDHVDHEVLTDILRFRVADPQALYLLTEIIRSHSVITGKIGSARKKGIPIGNLTSQIFANIYLHEFDRFMKHDIKPLAYARYGDDFVVLSDTTNLLFRIKEEATAFLKERLRLEINAKHDRIVKARQGLKFLGMEIFPKGRRLNKRNWQRVTSRLQLTNISSYSGLVEKHSTKKRMKEFDWIALEKLNGMI
ncbi:hypothetical protein A3C91_01545 [Candidatus Azambacteria bacterium RIFCSPHIGHO2_02_FULL_52_12]|uniref:Reverse transcriptase domain-containing protein n=1 Tax=Candidatus Azambacteria bacterium RIFCSPLOWO2_01_FULL_46_25 TaxID=1797298 RepID=A0A1F5BTS6_9BACT|nr:MAG: hypothetical protein A3C91_01545 [Candidatus Azambacteria bacterium RIFCSPHIGHO2_02_FULL_52_12]OGD34023.1 MAG: hypothetical protein A2988_00880 [Candidatus Azambacteria bacterium RIFCSPLOWO2_01_FULL_46_25]